MTAKIITFPTPVKPWTNKYAACQHCNTTNYKHRSRGYCNHCYPILDRQGKIPYTEWWYIRREDAQEAAADNAWEAADHLKYDPLLREYVFWHLQSGHGGEERDNLASDIWDFDYADRTKGVKA